MSAPIFEVCLDNSTVTNRLGSNPMKFFRNEAPQGVTPPYAIFQQISGSPENYLAGRPDIDDYRMQIDVYAVTAQEADEIDKIIQTAIELHCHVISFNGQFTDTETRLERSSFDVRWFVNR